MKPSHARWGDLNAGERNASGLEGKAVRGGAGEAMETSHPPFQPIPHTKHPKMAQNGILHLSITTDKSPYPYETRFPATMALVEFKVKLELIVGIYVQDMRLELRTEDGRFQAELFGDDKTLEGLGVKDKCTIHVKDASGAGAGLGGGAEDGGASARYVLSDEKYDARKGKRAGGGDWG